MGCGASVDTNASVTKTVERAGRSPAIQDGIVFRLPERVLVIDDLPDCVTDMHHSMALALRTSPMRLLRITDVLTWTSLTVYEEVTPSACLDVPYLHVTDAMWDETAVVSWRRGAPKPPDRQPGFSPMTPRQFQELCGLLTQLRDNGLQYVWIDWSCAPQYSAADSLAGMVEILRSKVFYVRSRAMIIVPSFDVLPEPDSIVRPLLAETAVLLNREDGQKTRQGALTADALLAIHGHGTVASREYFARVWTLVERMARYGRAERLCNWISLEAWLGMVVEAMFKASDPAAPSQVYRAVLGGAASSLLDSILDVVRTMTNDPPTALPEGLIPQLAQLFELAVGVWENTCTEEAPTKPWLLSYIEQEAAAGIGPGGRYQVSSEADRVWAVYSFYMNKKLDSREPEVLVEALQDLGAAAGAQRRFVVDLARRMGVDGVLKEEEMDSRLFRAAEVGDVQLMQRLIDQGANVELVKKGSNPLFMAAQNGHAEAVGLLLAAGVYKDRIKSDGSTPLYIAAEAGHVEAVKVLLSAGADKDAANNKRWAPIHIASANGHLDVIKALIEAGVDKNVRKSDTGSTPLQIAAGAGHLEAVRFLLAVGADTARHIWTPLHAAAARGRVEVIKALIEAGVDKDMQTTDTGVTPLYAAVESGHLHVVKFLLSEGADKDKAAHDGKKPLDVADKEVIRALLR